MKTQAITDNTRFIEELSTQSGRLRYYSLPRLIEGGFPDLKRVPFSIKVLIESVLRQVNNQEITYGHLDQLLQYDPKNPGEIELPFKPARVLLQDFTGVPCVVDLAAMRAAMRRLGGNPSRINPEQQVNLVIDHSIQVDFFNAPDAMQRNAELEFERNRERYEFLKWGQAAFRNFAVVPPASGICHQVNLEYLGRVVQAPKGDGPQTAYFDSLVGTDSHTPMINGLGILGWGVGGIEAEAAMLGQPIYMLAPSVVGFRLTGSLRPGITATDLVLRVTEMLRKHGVVGKFVEFFGPGLSGMTVPDRATISNMAPEYGATVGYFPIDAQTLEYLYHTGRSEELIDTVRRYAEAQEVFRSEATPDPEFEDVLELELSHVTASVAGPKRPQDRIDVDKLPHAWSKSLQSGHEQGGFGVDRAQVGIKAPVTLENGETAELTHGDVAIAAITSCTNTSNPTVLLAAGLLAKHAVERGLRTKPYVKTSFAPGSMVVTEYLSRTGLMTYLEQLGYYLVGYGCTTCIGNSGPLPTPVREAVEQDNLVVAGVLSGNRNFEGRINPHTRANFLTSPPLVVAYGIAGTVDIDLENDPLGQDAEGKPVYLRDIWPSENELRGYIRSALNREAFLKSYTGLEESNPYWNRIKLGSTDLYAWDANSTYIQEPPFFENMSLDPRRIEPIVDAHVLVMAGDNITTDHISPAGSIDPDSPAGRYLQEQGVEIKDFNSYGSRRGNDRVMTRGTFANIRFRNRMAPGTEGSFTTYIPTGEVTDIFAAACRYQDQGIPTIVLAGRTYGMGSSRDWAAKGTQLLGVRAVIAQSYERIHRSNLVGMGVLPLEFLAGEGYESLGLAGNERYTIEIDDDVRPMQRVRVNAVASDGSEKQFEAVARLDSPVEVQYYRNGGILQTVLRRFLQG